MYKRLKVKLYPTKSQIEVLENHFNGYRYCYNLCLEYKQHLYRYHKINVSGFDMQKELFEIRKESDWLIKCKAECIREAGGDVDSAKDTFDALIAEIEQLESEVDKLQDLVQEKEDKIEELEDLISELKDN